MTGTNIYWISFGITAVCGVIAAFIGEHTVAAMMLPVGVTLITLTSNDPKKVHNLAAVHPVLDLLWLLDRRRRNAFGRCPQRHHHQLLEGLLLQSRRSRHVPLPHGLRDLDHLRLPDVPAAAADRHGDAHAHLQAGSDRHVARHLAGCAPRCRCRGRCAPRTGSPSSSSRLTIVGWVTLSNTLGLGVIAIGGAALFLILGLVRWEDINSGVNWGVVLLYAAAISLGVEMKATGAAEWVADSVFAAMREIGASDALRLQRGDLAPHHRRLQHHDGGCGRGRAGAHRAEDRGHRRPGSDQRRLRHGHFLGLRLSDAGRPAGLHHHLCLGLPQGQRLLQDRHPHDGRCPSSC